MSNLKISALPASTTPLAGTEVLPVVQSGATKQVSVANLTAGRTVGAGAISQTNAAGTIGYTGYTSGGSVSEHTYSNTAGLQVDTYQSAAGPNYTKTTDIVANADSGAAAQLRMFVTLKGAAPSLALVAGIDGNVTVSQGNLVQGTAAKGVNFTANTPAAGMTSQLLNWYEEGTFTPVATQASSAPTITYTSRLGKYTRIGRVVTAHIEIVINTASGGSGATQITGLPFAVNEGSYGGQGMFGYNDALANTVYGCWIGSTTVYFRSGARSSGNDTGGWSAGGYLELTLVYQV